MKRMMTTIFMVGFVAASAQAIADDSTPTQSPTQNQASMKDCMDKQKATNSSMTQEAMKTVCQNEAKRHKDKNGNDLATAPQDPKPQN
jgi:hypothetical protein